MKNRQHVDATGDGNASNKFSTNASRSAPFDEVKTQRQPAVDFHDTQDNNGRRRFASDAAPSHLSLKNNTRIVPSSAFDKDSTASPLPGSPIRLQGHAVFKNVDDTVNTSASNNFGIPGYERIYKHPINKGKPELCVPWYMRQLKHVPKLSYWDFMLNPQFWRRLDFAFRIALFATVVPMLIMSYVHTSPFVSNYFVLSAATLAARQNVGESLAYVLAFVRAGVIWLPLGMIAGALDLGNHIVAWYFYYTIAMFFLGLYTQHATHRIALLLVNACMVGILSDRSRTWEYSCRVMVDWCIGTGLCLFATFFPFPMLCKNDTQNMLAEIANNTGTAFRGLVHSFWSSSNVERNMAMTKVLTMLEALDRLFPKFEEHQAHTLYEFMFESAEVRELRFLKFQFFELLRINTSSMNRVLDMVQANPSVIDASDRSQLFNEQLKEHIIRIGEAFDVLMEELSNATTKSQILALKDHFDELQQAKLNLREAYQNARRILFYEYTSCVLEEFVAMMNFYMFTLVCFTDTVSDFWAAVNSYKPRRFTTMRAILWNTFGRPFVESVEFTVRLFRDYNRREVQLVVEALKIASAMILTIAFAAIIDTPWSAFTGPIIIPFITGTNPVETVQASMGRLMGCLIGTVLGFFAGTYSDTTVKRIISLSILVFGGTFMRNDSEYGIMSVCGVFILIPLDTVVPVSMSDAVDRMNQNTFSIFFYIIISAAIYPLSPSTILRSKRINLLHHMNICIDKLSKLFIQPLPRGHGESEHGEHNAVAVNTALRMNGSTNVCANLPVPIDTLCDEYRRSFCRNSIAYDPTQCGVSTADEGSAAAERGEKQHAVASARARHAQESVAVSVAEQTDLVGSEEVDYANVPPAPAPSRSLIVLPGHDAAMDDLNYALKELTRRLRASKQYVDFSKNERSLLEKDYPAKQCEATYYHMYRMTYLLRTMWLSWSCIRTQRTYTPEMESLLNSVYPVAHDVADAFSSFTQLMTCALQDFNLHIDGEIMKSVLNLITASNQLHVRKGQIILLLINSSVNRQREVVQQGHGKNANDSRSSSAHSKTADAETASAQAKDGAFVNMSGAGDPYARRPWCTRATNPSEACAGRCNINVPADAQSCECMQGVSSPLSYGKHDDAQLLANLGCNVLRIASSDRNITVMPLVGKSLPSSHIDDDTFQPAQLPASFQFPLTEADVEGLHTFTLCMQMFANETKLLMMSLCAMNDFFRMKI